jgi:phenylalanyl-tRNA synthetase beta chain
MLVSLRWLLTYVRCDATPGEIARRLTMAGLEVEAVGERGLTFSGVVAGRTRSLHKHPDSHRLRVCEVAGPGRNYQVVCGAPNVAVGQTVALALEGARLADGSEIRSTEIHGILSEGMLCSEEELGLGEDASGIMVLVDNVKPGIPLAEALGLEDRTLEISVTPNRGDCLSVLGIAREVAALFGIPLLPPVINLRETGPQVQDLAAVTIEDPDLCPRYAARVVQNVAIKPSPFWLRQRLASQGVRPINNIVDITNFVMLELGQPLHAFDYHQLEGHRIVVRRARGGESFVSLDGQSHTLRDDMLLICDGSRGVALAGIMGGLNSEITQDTSTVLIESAYFQPTGIRRTAKALGMNTESSYRFERGVDPEGVITALDRAAQLMVELANGELAAGRLDVYPSPVLRDSIGLRVSKTRRFLGIKLSKVEIRRRLESIQLEVRTAGKDLLQVNPPSFRPDLTREVDLMEEVARLAGFDRIPSTLPKALVTAVKPAPAQTFRRQAKQSLVSLGFSEILSYSFISPQATDKLQLSHDDRRLRPLPIRNPLSEDQSVMRTSLVPGLLETAASNQRQNNFDLRLFELSKVFFPKAADELPEERLNLSGLLCGLRRSQAWNEPAVGVDFFDAKGAVEALLAAIGIPAARCSPVGPAGYLRPEAAARVCLGESCLGDLGEIRPEVLEAFRLRGPVYLFDLDFDLLLQAAKSEKKFRPLPKFPAVNRDLAMVVSGSVEAQQVLDFLEQNRPNYAESLFLFDHYRGAQVGEGMKSLGFRITYRSSERNLTDQEVNEIHTSLTNKVLEAFQARLRE